MSLQNSLGWRSNEAVGWLVVTQPLFSSLCNASLAVSARLFLKTDKLLRKRKPGSGSRLSALYVLSLRNVLLFIYLFIYRFELTLNLHLVKLGQPLYIPDVQQTVERLGHTRSGFPGQSGQRCCGTDNCFRHTRNLDS